MLVAPVVRQAVGMDQLLEAMELVITDLVLRVERVRLQQVELAELVVVGPGPRAQMAVQAQRALRAQQAVQVQQAPQVQRAPQVQQVQR